MTACSGLRSAQVIALLVLWCGCGGSLQHTTTPFGSGGSRGSGGAGGVAGAGAASGTGGAGGASGTGGGAAIGGFDGGGNQPPGGPGAEGATCKTFGDCQCGLLCTNALCQRDEAHGKGEPGAACNRACDCIAGFLCLTDPSDPTGTRRRCSPAPQPDGGYGTPTCGDYVDCEGAVVSNGRLACNPQSALSCPSGSTLDSMQSCMWSVPSSCPSGQTCKFIVDGSSDIVVGSYQCQEPAGPGTACVEDTDCACGLACSNTCVPVETLTTAGMKVHTTVFCFGSCPEGDYCSVDLLHFEPFGGTCVPLAPRRCPTDGGVDASSGTPDGDAGGRVN